MQTPRTNPEKTGSSHRPVVVIVGAGFGGLSAARELRKAPVDVIVVDRTNHHLFQPLLYQVATAGLTTADIAKPIRSILRKQGNASVMLDNVQNIDLEKRVIALNDRQLKYDYLILATGARHSYFGNDAWETYAPGLKTAHDAIDIRRRVLTAFEIAEKCESAEQRRAAMTFLVVGGGPTGVEMAGAIAELGHFTLAKDFRHIDPRDARVLLVEAGPRVLSTFSPDLSEQAKKQLEKLGVEVRTGHAVTNVAKDHAVIGGERIDTRTIIWAAGNKASPLAAMLGCATDRQGRAEVHPDLTIPGHPEVQAVGDMVVLTNKGRPVPGVAPAAMQAGRHAAKNVISMVEGKAPAPFHYVDKGNLATIGRHAAVAEIGPVKFHGTPAWLAWVFIHLLFLMGFRNRTFVFLNWIFAYFTYSRGSRLIPQGDDETGA